MSEFATRMIEPDVAVVRADTRLTMVSAPGLRKELYDIVENGTARIVVDLAATEFIDSSGLGALISGLKLARQAGGDLRIASVNEQVRTVLELTNLDRILIAYDSPENAFDG
ncbi:STAS domain-containing protein [Mycolicibacterium sp. 3033]|nr:STAS domain-containing protein [Mycolicibacterium aurantiacum]